MDSLKITQGDSVPLQYRLPKYQAHITMAIGGTHMADGIRWTTGKLAGRIIITLSKN